MASASRLRRRLAVALPEFTRLPSSRRLREYWNWNSLDVVAALSLCKATFPGEHQILGTRQMNRPLFSHRLTVMLIAFFTLAFTASIAAAQSAGQLESELGSLSGQMSSAESSDSAADQVITRLDAAEGTFAKLTQSGKVDKGSLIPVYRH